VEDCALILSAPVYHARPNGYFMCITERLLPVMFSHMNILKKTRVGGIIGVGGGDWTALQLSLMNIYLQHTRILVDQMQVQYMPRPGAVLADPTIMARARLLGKRIAEAILKPIEQAKYLGEDTPASCPVCHCNVLHIPGKLTEVICPVCAVKGTMVADGNGMVIKWNEEDVKHPRFSEWGITSHMADVGKLHEKFFKEDIGKVNELVKKYAAYGNITRPGG
jgi:flavone/flavonol reductase